jgi:hypothetical protein
VAAVWELSALALVVAGLIAVLREPAARRAVFWSAGIAVVVQLVAFAIARRARAEGVFKAVGAGAILRVLALVVYALVFLEPLGLPPVPALLSLALLFFVTTVLESWLLTS